MSMNTRQARVIDPILSNVAQGYTHPERVGFALFPRVPVQQRGGQIIEFGRDSFKRYKTRRAPGGATKRVQFGYEGKPFALVQDALEGKVPVEHMQDAAQVPGIDLGTEATNEVMEILSLGLEIEQAEIALKAANYVAGNKDTLSGTDVWNDPNSDPAKQIREYREAVRSKVGLRPNTMVLSALGFNALAEHPKILERFKYTSSDSITKEMLAKLFNLRRLEVGEAVYMNEGSDEMVDVWGNAAVLAYVPEQVSSARTPSYGYTYTLQGNPLVLEPYAERNADSWIYPVKYDRAPVLSGIDSGFLIQGVTSA
ncbi:major capsid protein [Bordetella petrii]|uniref:Phage-related protein n=1 Tax=Bordetella petrii (strain ATCC BAA-461 / DSM 12804 / CCUG 43448 / CIP 107267 / Se-1111R) TaxID=340100 RepID=A9ID53_BORPD|nr:major capsid protein [Bordetella petrii]CAP44764.1 phage-related protein [Bordetella petrii]